MMTTGCFQRTLLMVDCLFGMKSVAEDGRITLRQRWRRKSIVCSPMGRKRFWSLLWIRIRTYPKVKAWKCSPRRPTSRLALDVWHLQVFLHAMCGNYIVIHVAFNALSTLELASCIYWEVQRIFRLTTLALQVGLVGVKIMPRHNI